MSQSLPQDTRSVQQPAVPAEKTGRSKRLIIIIAAIVVVAIGLWTFVAFTRPEIKTSTSTLVITKARLSDRVPPGCTSSSQTCITSEPGYRILLVWMKPKGGNHEPTIPRGVYVVADNGSQAEWFHQQTNVSPPWVLLAFAVKDSDRNFKVMWTNNTSVTLNRALYFIP